MRALRDFNIPKIVTDDMPVFMGLIGDLFPALDVPRKRDNAFEEHIKQAINDLKLQPEEGFLLKVLFNIIYLLVHSLWCLQIIEINKSISKNGCPYTIAKQSMLKWARRCNAMFMLI